MVKFKIASSKTVVLRTFWPMSDRNVTGRQGKYNCFYQTVIYQVDYSQLILSLAISRQAWVHEL